MNKVELHQSVLSCIETKYNVLYASDCREFDLDPQSLSQKLSQFQGKTFGVRDKILLVHMDTDYYDPLLPCGLIPINLIRIFKNLDIPLHALFFVTNHYGIKKEFDLLLEKQHPADRPTIIETVLSPLLLSERNQPKEINFEQIEKPAICMMNQQRSHRVALYNFFVKNNLLDKIAVSQNFSV